jgi:hypothetical protein
LPQLTRRLVTQSSANQQIISDKNAR